MPEDIQEEIPEEKITSEEEEGGNPSEENRVLESEMILWSFFLLGLDGICILIDLTGIGLAIAPFLQGFGTFSNGMWFSKAKGDKGAMSLQRQLIKYVSNFSPFLPTLFIAFAVETYMHNHPNKLVEKAKKMANAIPKK